MDRGGLTCLPYNPAVPLPNATTCLPPPRPPMVLACCYLVVPTLPTTTFAPTHPHPPDHTPRLPLQQGVDYRFLVDFLPAAGSWDGRHYRCVDRCAVGGLNTGSDYLPRQRPYAAKLFTADAVRNLPSLRTAVLPYHNPLPFTTVRNILVLATLFTCRCCIS